MMFTQNEQEEIAETLKLTEVIIPMPVELKIEQGSTGLIYVTSTTHKGLFLAEKTLADVCIKIPEALKFLEEAKKNLTEVCETSGE